MKKTLKGCLLVLSTALLLTGCGDNGGGGGEGGGGEKKGHFTKEVTIKLTHTTGQNNLPTLQAIVDAFKEIEPYVTVDIDSGRLSGNYDTIHSTTISDFQTGEYGDLVVGYGDHAADYLNYGKIVQLDPYMNNADYGFTEEEMEDLIPGFLQEGKSLPIPGTWMLPYSKSTEAMFYNEDRLIGLDLSEFDATINGGQPINKEYIENLTWEELFGKLCPAFDKYNAKYTSKPLITREPDTPSAYLGYDSESNLFITLAQQYGTGYTSIDEITGEASLNFNNAETKNNIKMFAEASKNGYIALAAFKNNNSYCSSFFTANNELFCIGSTAGVKNQNSNDFQVGIAPIPHAAGKELKVISQGPGICILDHGDEDRILASWLFYKYLTNAENSAKWATMTGYLPVRYSSYEDEVYIDACSEEGKSARDVALLQARNAKYSTSVSKYCFSTPSFKGSSTCRTQVGALMLNSLKDALEGKTIDDSYLNTKFEQAINTIKKDM